jgi:SagB-type dehydrogenase family enzyme
VKEDVLTEMDEELLEGYLLLETKDESYPWKGTKHSYSFHLATRNHESMTPKLTDQEVLEAFTSMSSAKGEPLGRYVPSAILKTIPLPSPCEEDLSNLSLFEAFKKRKTTRNFDGSPISLESLSTLLYGCFGSIHGKKWEELSDLGVNFSSERRANPSSSGLQACDCYLSVTHVDGLDQGFYYYDTHTHSLQLLALGCDDDMQSYLVCDQFWVKGAACGLFITVDMERIWHKSDLPRAYAYVFLEVGHISQNLLLGATTLDLKTWLTGTLRDGFISEKLLLDGVRCFPVSSVFIGNGTEEAVPHNIKELALKKKAALGETG